MLYQNSFDSRKLSRFRNIIVVGTILVILLFTLSLLVLVPNFGFRMVWGAGSELTVAGVFPDHPGIDALRPGDRIVAIDGTPVRRSPLDLLIPPGRSGYSYTIEREAERIDVYVPTDRLQSHIIRSRLLTGILSLAIWVIGALVLLLARKEDQTAWAAGLVIIFLALSLAASEAALYNIPLSWFLAEPILPLVALAYAELALLPRVEEPGDVVRYLFRTLYIFAGILGVITLVEGVFLFPSGRYIPPILSLSLSDIRLLSVALFLVLNPAILALRVLRSPYAHIRRQAGILLLVTGLALFPMVGMTILPGVIGGAPILSWEYSIVLLLLIPIGYAYVIYRHQYLSLDVVATRAITLLGSGVAFVILYGLFLYATHRIPMLDAPPGLANLLAAGFAAISVYLVSKEVERRSQALIYGPVVGFGRHVADFTTRMAGRPERETLASIFREACDLLHFKPAALYLEDGERGLRLVSLLEPDAEAEPSTSDLPAEIESMELNKSYISNQLTAPWARLSIPLMSKGEAIGFAHFGERLSHEALNALEIEFLDQVLQSMAVTAASIRLFESALAMSREHLRVREVERTQIAAQIHDDPLQRLTVISGVLNRLADSAQSEDLSNTIRRQRRELIEVIRNFRAICADLHSPLLSQGIGLAVSEAVERFQTDQELEVNFEIGPVREDLLSQMAASAVYHIVTEALNNIGRHARASCVEISLKSDGDELLLRISDNGRGFELGGASLSDLLRARRFGLVGMQEWSRLVNGTLEVKSEVEEGTIITLRLPLATGASRAGLSVSQWDSHDSNTTTLSQERIG